VQQQASSLTFEHFFGKARGDKMEEKKMGVEDF
jgi:hypothetical protein